MTSQLGPKNDILFLALDRLGRVLQFAPSAEKASGYIAAEMLHSDPFERLFAEDASRVREAFLSEGNDEHVELRADLRSREGHKRVVHWACWRQIPTADPVRYVVVGIDRSEDQAREERSRSSIVGALAAGLAHEIRNPLNGAGLHLSILERDLARLVGVSSSAHEAMGVVRSELRRLSSLVTDFLELTRPRPLACATTDVRDVVHGAFEHALQDASRRQIGLAADLPPDPVMAWIDAERLKRALVNLIQNALEAVDREGAVLVRLRAAGVHLELEVEDDGPGIPESGARVFEPFFTTKRTGTGLGLSIVHRTIIDHGGEITYTSTPGCTVFRMRLPARPPSGEH